MRLHNGDFSIKPSPCGFAYGRATPPALAKLSHDCRQKLLRLNPSIKLSLATVHRAAPRPAIRSLAVPPLSAQHVPIAMRALWLRATQTPTTCRCKSCLSSVSNAGVRGGASSLRRPRLLGAPTSIFLYTTIFAAGLTIDARTKAARNSQWDQAFAQLREEMDRPLQEKKTTADEGAFTETPDDIDWEEVRQMAGMEVENDVVDEAQLDAAAQKTWEDMRYDSRRPGEHWLVPWPANTGRQLMRYNLPPQSLWAPDTLRLTAMRRRHTWKKLAMQELSIGQLVNNLIEHVGLSQFVDTLKLNLQALSPQILATASLNKAQLQQAREDVLARVSRLSHTSVGAQAEDIAESKLHVSVPGFPNYSQDADGDFHDICATMNDSIRRLLEASASGDDQAKALAVAKICHNLLVSTAAPDVQTFNLLLSGFTLWGRYRLVHDVIGAFHVAKIRPNEITCKQILEHYTAQSRPDAFSRFVARMRGVGGALMLADPSITINEASEGRLVRIDEDTIYQKVHPSPLVYTALITGVLKFAGFDRTMDIYYEMKADGWGLDIVALTKLLADCIHRADWEGGTYVWDEVRLIKAHANSDDLAVAYHHMLSLCSVTGNTTAFNHFLNQIARRGLPRNSIIAAANEMTKEAGHKKDHLAPAWAADNLMITVSSYMHGANSSDTTDFEVDPFAQEPQDQPSGTHIHESVPTSSHNEGSLDAKEAWSLWLESEFGEKSKDPEPVNEAPMNAKEAWSLWLEGEFGEKPKDPEP